MQLPHILSPALCCLLTLSLQHVAGLAVPRPATHAVYPASCLGTLPSIDTPEVRSLVYSCIKSECGVASTSEQCTACIGDLVVDFKGLGEGSRIATCLCKNKGQVALHQEQSPQLGADQLKQLEEVLQQYCDPQDQVNGPSGSLGKVNRRQGGVGIFNGWPAGQPTVATVATLIAHAVQAVNAAV